MDLQVCAIIAIVFCVSLISLFFINQKLRGGRTFEDVLAEKRQLAHLVGGSKYAKKAGARKVNGDSNSRSGAKKESRKERKQKQEQERREQTPDEDSDAGSETQSVSSNSPAHSKFATDFSETEQLAAEEVIAPVQQSKKTKKQQARKNSASTKHPAMITLEPVAAIATANHFELPPTNHSAKEATAVADVDSNKKGKALAKAKKGSPKAEKAVVVAVAAAAAADPEPAVAAPIVEPSVTPKDSPKHQTTDGKHKADAKLNKKKRNDHANLLQHQVQQQLLHAMSTGGITEDVNVNAVMHLLGRADLSRSEIQIIIDYLLNKQQDTRTDHSDWSDDPLQKIRKQLADREQALAEEQEASAGLQTKLREMRATINTLNAENRARSAEVERIAAERQTEVQLLANENRTVRERLESDNQRLMGTCTQMHEELTKLQQQLETGADAAARQQQLADTNAQLQLDIVSLQQTVQQMQSEASQKAAEYEAKVHEIQVLGLQRDTDVSAMFVQHKEYVEQLKQEVDEQTARAKRLDDSSKVEIRNLQNALDSSNREANVYAQEANKWRQIHDDLKASAAAELQQAVGGLHAQLTEREAVAAQASQAVAQRDALIVQLQAQIGHNASQAASAEQQLSANAGEVKLRLGQETEKVRGVGYMGVDDHIHPTDVGEFQNAFVFIGQGTHGNTCRAERNPTRIQGPAPGSGAAINRPAGSSQRIPGEE